MRIISKLVCCSVAAWTLFSVAGANAAEPSREDLIKQAQQQGTLTIYSNSSRHSLAGEEFGKKYGIKVSSTQLKDVEIIEKIAKEASAKIKGADVVFVQDSGRVYSELIKPGYLTNYVPPAIVGKLAKEDENPLVFLFLVKAIVFNSEKSEVSPITNVWQLTDPDWKGRVQMKDPFQEGVNMNFLTMVTKPDIADKLAAAYKAHYGKDIALTTPNAGYEWIKKLFQNGLVLGTSDTKLSEAVGAQGQARQLAAIITTNKMRMSEGKKLALKSAVTAKPFAGFYYPMYAMIPSNSHNTAAAKLFIEYVLTKDGFGPWVDSLGDFSPNPDNPGAKDDLSLAEYRKIMVREDHVWCSDQRYKVEDFLNSIR